MKGKKILITGANGFVGDPLCRTLLQKKYFVRGAVRSVDSTLKKISGVAYRETGDINRHTEWQDIVDGIDCIIHLAARVHIVNDADKNVFDKHQSINTYGTENLAKAAASAGVPRFIYLSTVKVNGETTRDKPFDESDLPAPLTPYGISKFKAEEALRAVGKESNMEVVIVRSPLIYGPRVKANFYNLIKLVDSGIPLPFANLKNKRSLVGLANLIDFLICCIEHDRAAGEIFFISDGMDLTLSELIKKLAFQLNKTPLLLPFPQKIVTFLLKVAGQEKIMNKLFDSLQVDISKSKRILGWKPPFSTDQCFDETVKWYKYPVLPKR